MDCTVQHPEKKYPSMSSLATCNSHFLLTAHSTAAC